MVGESTETLTGYLPNFTSVSFFVRIEFCYYCKYVKFL